MQKSASGDEFGAVLEIIKAHRANALVSVNVEHLLTNWEIGGYLSAKIKHDGWGKSTIDGLVDYIHTHAPNERGYGRSSLYSMVAVYDEFTSPDFIALVARYGNRIVQMPSGQMAIPQVLLLRLQRCGVCAFAVDEPRNGGGVQAVDDPEGCFAGDIRPLHRNGRRERRREMNSIAVDAGRLTFAAAKMGAEIIPGLLESIRKATSERREYGKGKKAVRGSGAKAGV
jgi:hypothetical protein